MSVNSIKDIARLSGYSISTVSRVLNNTGRISLKTREKILKIAKENNYSQNIIAKGMRKGSLAIIGILVPDITNPYYASIVKKCEQNFFKEDYLTIVCNTERNAELEEKYISRLGNHMVDGLVIVSTQREIDQKQSAIPTVFIDRSPKLTQNTIIASSDNYSGAVLATNHLIDKDCYPILITNKNNDFSSNKSRIKGFLDTTKNRGITDPIIINTETNSDEIYLKKDQLKEKIDSLLKKHKKIGIFAINDNVASYMYQLAIDNNIPVPSKLSIVGFDDSPIAKKLQLTTIRQDTSKIAQVSCTNLLKLLRHEEILDRKFTIGVSLIKRTTT
mgnify:FL=1